MLFFVMVKVWSDVLTSYSHSLQIEFLLESSRQVNIKKQQQKDWIASSRNRSSRSGQTRLDQTSSTLVIGSGHQPACCHDDLFSREISEISNFIVVRICSSQIFAELSFLSFLIDPMNNFTMVICVSRLSETELGKPCLLATEISR